jgi:hypothetical protein
MACSETALPFTKIIRDFSTFMVNHSLKVSRVVWQKFTDVSEMFTSLRPDDGGSKYLWNVGQFLRDYTTQLTGSVIFSVSLLYRDYRRRGKFLTSWATMIIWVKTLQRDASFCCRRRHHNWQTVTQQWGQWTIENHEIHGTVLYW